MKKIFFYIILTLVGFRVAAQDLNARVQVLSPKIQGSNKRIFQTLETAMRDFLNGRKWSADPILPQERIDCNFVLNITNWDGSSNFSGELQVQSSRPVYNSTYSSTIMAFYAYVIIGLDYDTFSPYGGSSYFAASQTVINNAQTSSYRGWKAFDGNISRYWLCENLNNKAYAPLRSFLYDYHRNGLDMMADNTSKGLKAIASFLPSLQQVDRLRVGAMLPLIFYTAKSDELVSLFSKAEPQDRLQAMNLLIQADPANGNKYQTLQGTGQTTR